MAEKYTERIKLYCDENGIEIPPALLQRML
jgi:hypothetical protein